MILTVATVPLLVYKLKRLEPYRLEKIFRQLALLALCFDPLYWYWEWQAYGSLDLSTTLPLYLCSLFWIMMPFAAYAKPSRIKQMAMANLSTIGLLGGFLGMIFNVHLSRHAFFSFVPMRSLIYHYLMILVGVMLWTTALYERKPKDGLLALVPVGVLLVPCIALSHLFGWDYAFAAGGIGTPLEAISSGMSRAFFWLFLYGSIALVSNLFYLGINASLVNSSKRI